MFKKKYTMKKILLLLSLVAYCYVPLLAQSLTGELNPCPGTPYSYEITLAPSFGIPYMYNLSNVYQSANMTTAITLDGKVTYKYTLTWQNVAGTGFFTIKTNGGTEYTVTANIKGLSDVSFASIPASLSCSFRGNITVTANQVTNATSYVWSNTAGWTSDGSSSKTATFNINNANAGNIYVTAYNANCNNISKNNNRPLTRTQPTDTVVYSSAALAVCSSTSTTVTVTAPATGAVTVGYEWYAKPAAIIKINGGDYSETATLTTTTTSVTLTQVSATTTGSTNLYCRPIFASDCISPWAVKTLNVGAPTSTGFTMEGSKTPQYGADKARTAYSVCTREYLTIYPVNNLNNNIITHKWEYVSGPYISIGALNQAWLQVQISATYASILNLRYQYQTACGWSEWNNLKLIAYDCKTDPGTGLRVVKADTATAVENTTARFIIVPNPASSIVTVTVPVSGSNKGNMLAIVTDVKGSTVLARTFAKAEKFTLDVSTLPTGTYILQVQEGTKKVSKQFVVTH